MSDYPKFIITPEGTGSVKVLVTTPAEEAFWMAAVPPAAPAPEPVVPAEPAAPAPEPDHA